MDPNELTADEWYTIIEGTGATSGLVMMSDMSGPIGVSKEAMAATEALRDGKWSSPFMAALRTQMFGATKEQQAELQRRAQEKQAALKGQKIAPEQARNMFLDSIKAAVALVDSKFGATETGLEYRQLLYEIAQKTAQAGKEGTFLGMGGTQVSNLEEAALADIRAALNL
ncbi:MAG: hypothetical protein ACM3VW_09240 [Bacteroidota bacterium]